MDRPAVCAMRRTGAGDDWRGRPGREPNVRTAELPRLNPLRRVMLEWG